MLDFPELDINNVKFLQLVASLERAHSSSALKEGVIVVTHQWKRLFQKLDESWLISEVSYEQKNK